MRHGPVPASSVPGTGSIALLTQEAPVCEGITKAHMASIPPSVLKDPAKEYGRALYPLGLPQAARDFGVGWHTAMAAVRDHGQPLVEDPTRLDGVEALGLDETVISTPRTPLWGDMADSSCRTNQRPSTTLGLSVTPAKALSAPPRRGADSTDPHPSSILRARAATGVNLAC